jgi:hypothetical protein
MGGGGDFNSRTAKQNKQTKFERMNRTAHNVQTIPILAYIGWTAGKSKNRS